MYRQEDEQAEAEAAAAAARTEDLCDLNAYNRRLRATQSPNLLERIKNIVFSVYYFLMKKERRVIIIYM